jgi:hypothetical protein
MARVVGDFFVREQVGQDLEQVALTGAEEAGDPGAGRIRDTAMTAEILADQAVRPVEEPLLHLGGEHVVVNVALDRGGVIRLNRSFKLAIGQVFGIIKVQDAGERHCR